MPTHDALRQPGRGMAYFRKKADAIITGLEKPINDHLLGLVAVPGGDAAHRRTELLGWLDEVAEIRLRPHRRPGSRTFYYTILFDEPFGGVEVENVAGRLRRLALRYPIRDDLDPAELADRLRRFHEAFAEGCAAGRMDLDAAGALIDAFVAGPEERASS